MTIGSDLSRTAEVNHNCGGGCTIVQTVLPGVQLTAPLPKTPSVPKAEITQPAGKSAGKTALRKVSAPVRSSGAGRSKKG